MLWAICFHCKDSQPEKPTIIKPVTTTIKKELTKSKPVISSDTEPKTGLQTYTKSHLNHKMNIDYKSINSQVNCIEYNGRYILHKDIINWFVDYIK